jgi:hypothetical protein
MRLQHAKQAAIGLPTDQPDRVQARAATVAEVERLRWRVWNGKAQDARRSIERIRRLMHVFKDKRGYRTTGAGTAASLGVKLRWRLASAGRWRPGSAARSLSGDDLLLQASQQPPALGQGQAQAGQVGEITGPGDPHDVGAVFLALSSDAHQPHDPDHVASTSAG